MRQGWIEIDNECFYGYEDDQVVATLTLVPLEERADLILKNGEERQVRHGEAHVMRRRFYEIAECDLPVREVRL